MMKGFLKNERPAATRRTLFFFSFPRLSSLQCIYAVEPKVQLLLHSSPVS